jgi:serine/threonine protein kinase
VDANSPRWHRVTPSTFPWEDEAIEFLRSEIADADPNRAWSNFEFISGGVISEVDVFLLTRKGAFLIEIKSTPGRLVGDQQRWTFHRPDGGRSTMENPLLGANRKAKRIKSLLEHKWRKVAGSNASPYPPFIQPVVFLSDPDLKVELTPDARARVFGRDKSSVVESTALEGIIAGVNQIGAAEANNPRFHQLNTPTTSAVAKALDEIGIKESNHTRRVGSWLLRLDTVTERPGIQDFVADHQQSSVVHRRVRIYSKQPQMSDEQATSLRLAADREFLATERVTHPNVVRAFERFDTDLGSAVVFEHEPTAMRLDHWLASHEDVDLDDRLSVLRQLAETLQAVHRRRVTHRSLSPGSVLVRPGRTGEPPWVVLVTDFSLAGRDHPASSASAADTRGGTRAGTRFGLPTAAPGDAELLADEAALLFCAPELMTEDDPDGVPLDVFSFGAIAFQVLSGLPPGDSPDAVRSALRAGQGLQLASAMPGIAEALHDLVLEATRPLVSERSSSFDDVLAWLDMAEEQLTAPATISTQPEELPEIDPLDAKAGERLGDGSVVKRRLGRGSTAVALLVDRGPESTPQQVVYKVSLGGDSDARLQAEARILDGLRHPGVVELFSTTELGGRPVLVEAVAGTQSLADELRRNGTPGIEFLERWGSDLLEAIRYLEREGRFHRDIKPDNLGVTEIGANREQRLVLFDFSLAAAKSTDLRAGTPPYLEPFLADRPNKQWDLAAERYAVAVTLYEMATGEVPRWGDGRSDPAFTTSEVTLDIVLFDPAARDPLEEFFTRALRRDPDDRFGNAEEMLRAWQRVFEGLDAQPVQTPGGANAPELADSEAVTLPEQLSLDDPILSLGASAKVVSALNRLNVSTVRQLADLVPADVTRARRISPRVRRRIQEIRAAVRSRFADDLAGTAVEAGPAGTATVPADDPAGDEQRVDLDHLLPMLVPPAGQRGSKGSTQSAVRMLLGLEPVPGAESTDWSSQTAIAEALGITRGRLGQIGPAARKHWADLVALRPVRDELVQMVAANGGVAGVRELTPLLAETRGTGLPPSAAGVAARAVARAAIEAEELGDASTGASSRLVVRRRGDRVIVALDVDGEEPGSDDVSSNLTSDRTYDGGALAAYASALGDKADGLAGTSSDVVPQDRAVAQLRKVAAPEGVVLSDGRLLRLAAACSQGVAVSSALELYPVDLDAVRALRLARQSLASAVSLTPEEIRSRVLARFPLASVPSRPELDVVLQEAEVAVAWSDEQESFVRHATVVGDLSSMTSLVSRQPTRMAGTSRPSGLAADQDPDVALAEGVEGRLQHSLEHGGFLALRVPTSQRLAAKQGLAHFTGAPHGMVTVDLERWFLDELRGAAEVRRVPWATLVNADLAVLGTPDYTNLRILTREAAAGVEARVLAAGERVLAWNPGALAAYDELGVIDRVRGQAGLATSKLQTLWLVVFGSTAEPMPTVDGQAIPVLGTSEWFDLPEPWLRNIHRRHLPTGTDTQKGTS